MSQRLQFEVAGDCAELNPNKRMCWQAKAAKVKKWRRNAYLQALSLISRPGYKLPFKSPVKVTLIANRGRTLDVCNIEGCLSLKGIIDGLRDAKVIVDDTPKHVRRVVEQKTGEWARQFPFVEVIVEETQGDADGSNDNKQ